jgi:PKD repeat protein
MVLLKNIEDSKVLKYNWSFGDSTAILDSSAASHNYKSPGNYEVKLSMVARNDSTDKIFQKCVTKNVTVLNKEDYMNYYLKSVVRANKRKGFNSDMLGLTHLEFLAPDTSTLALENLFDASPVFIPNSKILSYNWNFGDSLKRIKSTQIKHAFDSVKVYEVKLNVVYQNDSTKGIYEQSVKKECSGSKSRRLHKNTIT